MDRNDIILTGIPRSGTFLVCYLLNQLPNIVALSEPMDVSSLWKFKNRDRMVSAIANFFSIQRRSLLLHGIALSKATGGEIPDNSFGNDISESGLRKSLASLQTITIEKPLSDDFILVIKHPNAFTALLESLIEEFTCFAVIRNPLAILSSWNTVNIPPNNGHTPVAESLDAELLARLESQEDRYRRQITLLSWYYEKYKKNLPKENIIRYEHVVASAGRCLEVISANANKLIQVLENKNKNTFYDSALMRELGTMLLNTDGAYWDFYSKDEVDQLMSRL